MREKQEWELDYEQRVNEATREIGIETSFSAPLAQREACDPVVAAKAIVDAAEAAGGGATTNVFNAGDFALNIDGMSLEAGRGSATPV